MCVVFAKLVKIICMAVYEYAEDVHLWPLFVSYHMA